MKKGEMRRKEILDAAEKLFYEKGYEATSVQDILDALQLSKGGFYHHFDTKMSVLEAICERRAEAQFEAAAQEIRTSREGTLERLNKLLSKLVVSELAPFSLLLLTSDGVHDYVDIDTLEDILNGEGDYLVKCETMIAAAVSNGSEDDLTVVIVIPSGDKEEKSI